MKRVIKSLKTPAHIQAAVALSLGAVSLIVLLTAFRLNFQQSQLYSQVIRLNAVGEQEVMIFRDYREQEALQVEKFLSDCLQRNEIFGDGTGEVCEVHERQLTCVRKTRTQENVIACLNSKQYLF